MSTRILPPPARISRVFDDGDVPLSAKAIDEDWFQPRAGVIARIIAQPLIDDDFVQVVVIALDDSTWTLWPVLPASLKAQPWADDEVGGSLANFVADADGIALSYVQTLTYGQPFAFDEDLSFIALTITQQQLMMLGAGS